MHVSDSYAGSPFLWPNKLSQAINVSAVPSFESIEAESKARSQDKSEKSNPYPYKRNPIEKISLEYPVAHCLELLRVYRMKSDFFRFSLSLSKMKKKMKWFFFSFLISRHSRRARNRKCSLKQDPLHPPGLLHWSSPAACWISISTTSCTAPSLQKVNAKVKLPKDNQKLYAAPSKSKVWAKQSAWAQRELRSFPTGFSSISLFFSLFFTASAQYH